MKFDNIYSGFLLSLAIPAFSLALYHINIPWIILISIYCIWYIAEAIIEIYFSKQQGEGFISGDNDHYSRVLLVFVRNMILAASSIYIISFQHTTSKVFIFIGLIFFIVGFVLRISAIFTLGKQFTMVVNVNKDYVLINDGIYATIRHPGYCGLFLIYMSFALLSGSLPLIIVSLVSTLLVIIKRIKIEERLLAGFFKEKYEEYINKTWAILPYLY